MDYTSNLHNGYGGGGKFAPDFLNEGFLHDNNGYLINDNRNATYSPSYLFDNIQSTNKSPSQIIIKSPSPPPPSPKLMSPIDRMEHIGASLNILRNGKIIDSQQLYYFGKHCDVYDRIFGLILLDNDDSDSEIDSMKCKELRDIKHKLSIKGKCHVNIMKKDIKKKMIVMRRFYTNL